MQTIEIKSGTSASISISPKINGVVVTPEQLVGVTIYVFFVYQFTNRIYKEPYELKYGNLTISLTPRQTVEMLGTAENNQKFEVQFAIKNADGDIIADNGEANLVVNIIRWEAGQWLSQQSTK
jgi:hypothetical protein